MALLPLGVLLAAIAGACSGGSPPPTFTCPAATPVALTIKNFDDLCVIGLGYGGVLMRVSEFTYCVAGGKVAVTAVGLDRQPIWRGTSGDTGKGDPGSVDAANASTATVVVNGDNGCVSVCCAVAEGPSCPSTPLCP
jgi:hypothetical protein